MLAVLVSACAATPPRPGATSSGEDAATSLATRAGPKRLTAAIRGIPPSLSSNLRFPGGSGGSVPGADALADLVQAGLVQRTAHGLITAQLALATPSIDNGQWQLFPDGRMATTVQLRPDARWHDGVPITTDDLRFSATALRDPAVGIPRPAAFNLIDEVEALDAATMRVTWKQPYIEADALFSVNLLPPLPQHLLQAAYQTDPENLLAQPYWTQEFVGAGPFRVQAWVADSHLSLRASPDYVLGRPKIDEIEVRFIPDPSTLMANVLADVELTIGRALSFDQAIQMRERWHEGQVALRSGALVPITPQFIGTDPPIVQDVRFRRALLQAIDRQQLVDSLMAGESTIGDSFINPGDPAYPAVEASIVRYGFDARAAVQGIEGLGYTRNSAGVFASADGTPLSFSIFAAAQNDRNPKVASAAAGFWRAIGLGAEQVILPVQRFQDVVYRTQFPAFAVYSTSGGTSALDVQQFHSSATPLPENGFRGGGNPSRYRSPELDALIERYLTTIPLAERRPALAGIVHYQTENLTNLPLFFDVNATMVGRRLANVGPRGDRSTEAWNAHEWDLTS